MTTGLPETVDAVLPLSPAQSGILFHSLGPKAAGSYVGVVCVDLHGDLDTDRLRAAFTDAVNATDALRAAFVWEAVKRPLQVVQKRVDVPWDDVDWQGERDIADRTADLTTRYRQTGFDLTKAPLMHVTLARLGPDQARLIWAVHHIVSDGWSTRCVLTAVLARYNGMAVAEGAQFRDYLGWLKARDGAGDRAFWQRYLSGVSAPTRIESREAPDGEVHQHAQRMVPATIADRIDAQARSLRITQSTLLSTVWALVLRRYARSDDIVFGATNAGRPADLPGADRAAGAFLNTLPLRVQFDPQATVAATLQTAEAETRKRRAFEATALADVQAWSDLPAGTPIFDYVFAYERLPDPAETAGPLRLGHLETVQSSNYSLTCLATPGDGLRLEIYFDAGLFSASAIATMLEDFERLLTALLDRPQATIADLGTALPALQAPDPVVATPILAALAQADPEAPALSDSHETLAYAALTDRVTRLGKALVAAGVRPGDVIPVALPRGVGAVVAMLAVVRAGAAYVPLDIAYPRMRIEQVLEAVQPRLVVTASDVPTFGTAPRFFVDGTHSQAMLPPPPGAEDLAYVIFTSGSQGRPKGVPITHAALAQSTAVRDTVYGRAPGVFLLLSSLAFDSSVVGLYWTLTTGGHLVIGDGGIEQDPPRLAGVIAAHQIRTTLCLPRLYETLIATGTADLRSLDTVIVAGEPVPVSLIDAHRKRGGAARLFNEYGPTEATVWCSAVELTEHTGDDVPIGRPIPGVTLAICDRDGRPLPDGVVGEIVVAGPTVAAGYLGPGVAASPFRTDGQGLRSYATGDLGLRRPDGQFLFLEREDQQVKIRGHRVDLSEVNAVARAVSGAPDVAGVVVDTGGRPAIALCLAQTHDAALAARLTEAFEVNLPAYARPARLHWMPAFPHLPNGKVDVKALARAAEAAPASPTDHMLPQGDTEERLAAIWGAVLGNPRVSREADFFDLGGDSLLSIGLFVKAEQEGLPIQPTDVFEHPTLRDLAATLVRRSARNDSSGPATTPLSVQNADGPRPPVFLLHGNMWIYRQLGRGLGADWPVALQFSHHFHGSHIRLGAGIERFAREAQAALQSVRPGGPYVLCGYSAGAMITLDLARQLTAQRHEVPLVCLIDPPYDGRAAGEAAMTGLPMQGLALSRGLAGRAMERIGRDPERHRRNVVSQAYVLAMRRYRLARYDGAVHVLQTAGNPAMAPGGTLATALPMAEVETLPFGHDALLSDNEARLSLTSRLVRRIRQL
ncbi:MAG: amino acid adenylation domain-containing protein [Pseudomonadota bacterium]